MSECFTVVVVDTVVVAVIEERVRYVKRIFDLLLASASSLELH